MAAIVFVGAVASNLIASDLQQILQPYRRWVWVTIAVALVALVVVVATSIVEARRRTHLSNSDAPGSPVNASAKRSAAFGGDVNGSTIVTGDKNSGLAAKNLDTLSAADARDLLLTIAPRIETLANEIAALWTSAAGIATGRRGDDEYRNLSAADYVRRLRDRQERLQLIEASLRLSYELLSEELRQRWAGWQFSPHVFCGYSAAANSNKLTTSLRTSTHGLPASGS